MVNFQHFCHFWTNLPFSCPACRRVCLSVKPAASVIAVAVAVAQDEVRSWISMGKWQCRCRSKNSCPTSSVAGSTRPEGYRGVEGPNSGLVAKRPHLGGPEWPHLVRGLAPFLGHRLCHSTALQQRLLDCWTAPLRLGPGPSGCWKRELHLQASRPPLSCLVLLLIFLRSLILYSLAIVSSISIGLPLHNSNLAKGFRDYKLDL